MSLNKNCWPSQILTISQLNTLIELKHAEVSLFSASKGCPIQFKRFSKYTHLVRTVAYDLRFTNNCRENKLSRAFKCLSVQEIERALLAVVKFVQQEQFLAEIQCITNNTNLPTKSKIIGFNPFIDENGLIRVGGKLTASNLEYDRKHPILLQRHQFTKLLFRYEHLRLAHAGPQLLLSSIRDKYWPLGGKIYAKLIVHECNRCFRCKPRNIVPQMGNLSAERINQAMPFQYVGVDYAGPFQIKNRPGRGSKTRKCYVALFIYFVTKAIHIEAVTDLSTEAFIASLKRFIARCGKPSKLYSDNGSNFVGAKNELKKVVDPLKVDKNMILDRLSVESISWSFIPPNSPHFGGLWEAGIKSLKFHLKRVVGTSVLTFEQLSTLLTQN